MQPFNIIGICEKGFRKIWSLFEHYGIIGTMGHGAGYGVAGSVVGLKENGQNQC